ncbi:MAG: hypothetical protein DLM50_06700 [Candidatus Meridianibacter frigidus]|nr:MAG: hypothetical protein DLM50_06700 [Candidatus Eremiobacteraeota bacterium]
MEARKIDRELILAFGPYELDAQRLLLLRQGQPVPLGPKVVETLLALIERAGALLTKDELLERIWPEGFVEEANLAQNIYVLRKTLREHWNEKAIETIPRRGYRFVAHVTERAPTSVSRQRNAGAPATATWRFSLLGVAAVAVLLLGITMASGRSERAGDNSLSRDGQQAYALGRYYWNLRTHGGIARSVRYFASVTKSDAKNALGYAALADAYSMTSDYDCKMRKCATIARLARQNARRALALNPLSPEAHTALAMTVELFDHSYTKADIEYRRAIALDPGYALAHEWYGTSLMLRGRVQNARRELETAVSLEPVATATNAWLGMEAFFDRRFGAAISYNRQALDLDPHRMDAMIVLGLAQEQSGEFRSAMATFNRLRRECRCDAMADVMLAGVRARMGERAAAQNLLLTAVHRSNRLPADEVALVFIALGERNQALAYMRKARFKHPADRTFLALDPRLDPVRADPRFRAWTHAS